MCVLIVDDGSTMISRALRVTKEYEGLGITRALKKHAERVSKELGVSTKAMVFGEDALVEKMQRENKKMVFKKVNIAYY